MNFTFDLTISLGLIATLALALIGWVRHRLARVDTGFETAKDERRDLAMRVTAVEQAVASLPGHKEVHNLQLTMANIAGELREMRAMMDGSKQIMARVESMVTRQEDHMLESAKR